MLVRFALLALVVSDVHGHARLMEPPARNSMWRFGFVNPINYNDNEVFCGGFSKQWEQNNGECAVCGDGAKDEQPRDHEQGGLYAGGGITKTYLKNSIIDLEVECTANHKGRFDFKLCPVTGRNEATQECLDKYRIVMEDGADQFIIPKGTNMKETFKMKGRLPEGLVCDKCVLQWTWRSANTWGNCGNGTSTVGCGPQETFRNCADIRIVSKASQLPAEGMDNPRALYVNDPSSKSGRRQLVVRDQVCVATKQYQRFHGMSSWCQTNCLAYPPNCPPSICTCLTHCKAKEGGAVTDLDCSKNCLRFPHDKDCPRDCNCGKEDIENTEAVVLDISDQLMPEVSREVIDNIIAGAYAKEEDDKVVEYFRLPIVHSYSKP